MCRAAPAPWRPLWGAADPGPLHAAAWGARPGPPDLLQGKAWSSKNCQVRGWTPGGTRRPGACPLGAYLNRCIFENPQRISLWGATVGDSRPACLSSGPP